jgi:hypothetical protein
MSEVKNEVLGGHSGLDTRALTLMARSTFLEMGEGGQFPLYMHIVGCLFYCDCFCNGPEGFAIADDIRELQLLPNTTDDFYTQMVQAREREEIAVQANEDANREIARLTKANEDVKSDLTYLIEILDGVHEDFSKACDRVKRLEKELSAGQ